MICQIARTFASLGMAENDRRDSQKRAADKQGKIGDKKRQEH